MNLSIKSQIGFASRASQLIYQTAGRTGLLLVSCSLFMVTIVNGHAAESIRTFGSTGEAVEALEQAVAAGNVAVLQSLFGPGLVRITSPDPVQAKQEFRSFAAALTAAHEIRVESGNRAVLEVGNDLEPFAVPLAKQNGRWSFDTAAGVEEIINRRIGRNELSALKSIRAYVDAQRDYAGHDRDGDEVLEYAQRLVSSNGARDGLYWPLEPGGDMSPLGPYLAFAQDDGYLKKQIDPETEPQAFYGYYFKILTAQGSRPPGGRYNYVINGNMIGGFALVAWPSAHGETGVMTFVINQQGRVYQKDLGPTTAKEANGMKEYNPDDTWSISPD